MGWFEDSESRTLGDEPLDLMRRCLVDIAAAYREAVGRPPALDELKEILTLVLRGSTSEIAAELDDNEVVAVQLKTKKTPAKQAWKTGDVVVMSLPDGTYAFSRVISREPPKKGQGIIEVFRYRSCAPVFHASITQAGRLFDPVNIDGIVAFEQRRWRIVAHEPGYQAPDHDTIRIYAEYGENAQLFDAEYRTVVRRLPRSELPKNATDMELYTGYSAKDAAARMSKLEQRVAAELDALGIRAE